MQLRKPPSTQAEEDDLFLLTRANDTEASTLAGYRRDAAGLLAGWTVEADGSLWSNVLCLRLVVDADLLLAETADGEWPRSPEQESVARLEAEAENERLRQDLARLKRERP